MEDLTTAFTNGVKLIIIMLKILLCCRFYDMRTSSVSCKHNYWGTVSCKHNYWGTVVNAIAMEGLITVDMTGTH